MIIYGNKQKQLAHQSSTAACAHCGKQELELFVFQKYFHVFFIPFVPVARTGLSQCNHCSQVLKPNQMPVAIANDYEQLKKGTKTSPFMFIGAAILAYFIIVGVVSDNEIKSNTEKYMADLHVNDILTVKTDEGHYTLLKVSAIEGEDVYMRPNTHEVLMESGVDKLGQKDMNFTDDQLKSTRKKLQQNFKEDKILRVIRY